MLVTEKKFLYKAFGLSILSEISFSELNSTKNKTNIIDVEIKFEDLEEQWSSLSNMENDFVIKKGFVMFQAYDIAIFSITNGKTISVSPLEGYKEDMVRLWILGTCMGALLLQRKAIPLHGSAVVINGSAYAIVGDSGAGKSTLASAFLNKGFKLLTDDVIAVTLNKENTPIVTPAYPQQKLWEDSLGNFGMGWNEYNSIHGRENKYCVPIPSGFYHTSVPLAGVIELEKTENKGEIEIVQIEGLKRFYTLYYNTFRNFLIKGLGLMEWHFQTCAAMVNRIDVYKLYRPNSGFNAVELSETILSTLYKGE
jgi:hypothetical protein